MNVETLPLYGLLYPFTPHITVVLNLRLLKTSNVTSFAIIKEILKITREEPIVFA